MATPGGSVRLSNVVVLCLAMFMLSSVAEARGKVFSHDPHRRLSGAAAGSVVDVTKFGARSDDPMLDNAQPFIQAWDAACKGPGGAAKVVIPPGNYITGPVVFQGPCTGPVTIEVQGTIQSIPQPSLYTIGDWFTLEYVDGVFFKGGVFDGQGSTFWQMNDCTTNPNCVRMPVTLHVNHAKNVHLEGVTSLNSMGSHATVTFSSNITATKLNFNAPAESTNTEGIRISSTSSVSITDSSISTGDNCLSIMQGSSDIFVSGVQCGSGHGISIGSLGQFPDEMDVRGVHVRNCTLTGTTNGVAIKSFPGKLQIQAYDITFEDIVMNSVANPILVDQFFGLQNKIGALSSVKVHDVHFRNIRGTSASPVAVSLACSSLFPCVGIELADIDLSYTGPKAISASCSNAKPIFTGKMNPPACSLV